MTAYFRLASLAPKRENVGWLGIRFGLVIPHALPIATRLVSLEGRLRSIPPPILLRAFLGMFFSYYITEILIGEAFPAEMREGALDHFVDIFLHGVLAPEAQ